MTIKLTESYPVATAPGTDLIACSGQASDFAVLSISLDVPLPLPRTCFIHTWFQPGVAKHRFIWKPFKRFPLLVLLSVTWLKPGVNKIGQRGRPRPHERHGSRNSLNRCCAAIEVSPRSGR